MKNPDREVWAMNGEKSNDAGDLEVEKDVQSADEPEDTIVSEDLTDVDNVGDISVEIDVEELIAKIEAGEGDAAEHQKEIRRRLDELDEQRKADQEVDSTFNFDINEDV